MKAARNQPFYKSKPIRSIESLANALKLDVSALVSLANNSQKNWKNSLPVKNSDGSTREVDDAKQFLKLVHRRIQTEVLSKVEYPDFLNGGIKGGSPTKNAKHHINKSLVINEDIQKFYPSTSEDVIFNIWHRFFNFDSEVAKLLTKLTAKDGCLPQGGICSTFLANLVFWDLEPELFDWFSRNGFDYTRFVDDITVSSKKFVTNEVKSLAISKIYGMLIKKGYRAKRKKHEIHSQSRPMVVTKLVVNSKVSKKRSERNNLRLAVYNLKKRIASGERGLAVSKELNSLTGKVGLMGTLHRTESLKLKIELKSLRSILRVCPIQNTTNKDLIFKNSADSSPPF